jgi:hypothetical protein
MSSGSHDEFPPPSPALLDRIGAMRPVRTRRPWRALAGVAGASLVYAAAWVAGPSRWIWGRALRRDLGELPRAWLVTAGGIWLLAFLTPLALAMIPRRGQLLHRTSAARWSAIVGIVGLALFALTARIAPGVSLVAASRAQLVTVTAQCAAAVLSVALVPIALAVATLRRALATGAAAIGAAVGAAGGALGGLALHLHCPWAEPAHVLLGHAVPVAAAAVISSLVAARFLQP